MDETGKIAGKAISPTPPAADMRYEDDDPDAVARVLVRVDYADGRIREYEAREPRDFQISDPESLSSISFRRTGISVSHGGGFSPLTAGVSSLRLSFTAHPRWNLHIRTERTAEPREQEKGPLVIPGAREIPDPEAEMERLAALRKPAEPKPVTLPDFCLVHCNCVVMCAIARSATVEELRRQFDTVAE